MPNSFLRQLSNGRAISSRWTSGAGNQNTYSCNAGGGGDGGLDKIYGGGGGLLSMKKRIMVLVDHKSDSKHAMMWALTHVANKGDLITLLHVLPPPPSSSTHHTQESASVQLTNSLAILCKISKPEVEVEALVIQGPKLSTVLSQVKKLEVSALVLGQKKMSSSLINCFCGSSGSEEFVEECIKSADCVTIGVRKQSKGRCGYLISTRWQRNFWLLA